jgi:hypothetical protein
MRRLTIAAISVLALLVAAAWAGAARPRHRALFKCVPGHSHLIAIDTRAQVYFAPEPGEAGAEAVYGCAYGYGHSYFIGKGADCGSSGCVGVEHEVLAGPIVAYEDFSIGGVGSMSASYLVVVRDLRSGRVLRRLPTGVPLMPKPGYVGVGNVVALVVKSDGSVAWIADDYERSSGTATASEFSYFDVWATDKSGSRLLASGSDIDPSSLALSVGGTNIGYYSRTLAGNTLSWTQGGKPFSATLN